MDAPPRSPRVVALDRPDRARLAATVSAGAAAITLPIDAVPRAELAAWARAGRTHGEATVGGPDARSHDFVVGRDGAYEALYDAIGEARVHGLGVVARTPLTRSTARSLAATAQLLGARGVAAWCVDVVPADDARVDVPWPRTPRLALALPAALHAVERARALGVLAFVRGAPTCLLGPLVPRALPAPTRAFAPRCDGCPARATCAGVDAAYLARYGAGELDPRRASPPRAAECSLLGEILAAR